MARRPKTNERMWRSEGGLAVPVQRSNMRISRAGANERTQCEKRRPIQTSERHSQAGGADGNALAFGSPARLPHDPF